MAYTRAKKLTDPTYAPTNPASESDIRSQVDGAIQEVYDMMDQTGANNSGAHYLKVAPIPGVLGGIAGTLYAVLSAFYTLIQNVVLGQIPDGTLTDAKLSITTGAIKDRVSNIAYNPSSYGAVYDGMTDDTQALLDCIYDMPDGARLQISGPLRITSSIVIHKLIHIFGLTSAAGCTEAERATSCIIKDGNFSGIVLGVAASSIEDIQIDGAVGNGGPGLVFGESRIKAKNVTVTNQGGHGIDIGSVGNNWNIWCLENVKTLHNGGSGINVDDVVNSSANCNAGYCNNIDTRENAANGITLGKTNDNTIIASAAQLNAGIGIEAKSGAKGNQFIGCYTESNTGGEIILQTGADRNYVYGYRSGVDSDSITDNGNSNFVLGRDQQENFIPYFKSPIGFKDLIIDDPVISGYWKMIQNAADRALEISLEETSATPVSLRIKHGNGGAIRLLVDQLLIGSSTSYIKANLHKYGSINAGTVTANSSKEIATTQTGSASGNVVYATPASMPTGIVWNAYVSATDTVTIRLANLTSSDVVVGSIAWAIDVWQY